MVNKNNLKLAETDLINFNASLALHAQKYGTASKLKLPSSQWTRNFVSVERKAGPTVYLVCAAERWGHDVYIKAQLKGYQKRRMGSKFLTWPTRIEIRAWHRNLDYKMHFKGKLYLSSSWSWNCGLDHFIDEPLVNTDPEPSSDF